ncbi:MAG: hypothetical protein Kow0063_22290 [Anaerolineae bacterium]
MGRQQGRETLILLLLIYNTFIGGASYGLYLFYPRLVTQILYFGLVVWWLVNLARQRRPFPRSPLDLPLLLLGGIILATTIFSVEPRLSLEDIPLYFIYVMIYYIVVDHLQAGWPASSFLKGLVMTTSVVCIFAGLEYLAWYFGLPVFPAFKQGWWSIGGWQDPIPPYLHPLSYTLNNANFLASLLALVIPVGVAVAVITRSRWTRINAIAWVLVNGTVLLLTFSRGGLLAALAGLLTLVILLVRRANPVAQIANWLVRNRRLALPVGAGILIVAVVALAALPVGQALNRPRTASFRLAVWDYALQIVRDYPVTGTGPRTFGAVIFRYWDPTQYPAYYFRTAHNVIMHAGAEIGIPGALMIALICLIVLRTGYRQYARLTPLSPTPGPGQSPPVGQPSTHPSTVYRLPPVLMAGVISGLVGFGVHSLVDNLLAVPAVMLPVIIMAAICCARPQGESSGAHFLLTPGRGLLLTFGVAGLVAWSLYSQSAFGNVVADTYAQRWASAAARLDQLPAGSLPPSFRHFQKGLIYGKLALDDPNGDAMKIAIASYQSGLNRMSQYVPGHANLAALYWQMGDLTGAHRELQTVTRMANQPDESYSPNVSLYWLNLGLLLEQQGNEGEAIDTYGRLLAFMPSLAESVYWTETEWRRQNWSLIQRNAEMQIEQLYPPAEVDIRKGELAYFSGDLSRAAELFETGMVSAPFRAGVWLGEALNAQGRYQEALAILEGVPGDRLSRGRSFAAKTYVNLGRANLALGREEAAIHNFRMALFLDNSPDQRYSRWAQYDLGRLALDGGDVESAISFYRQSLPSSINLPELNLFYTFLFYRNPGIYDSNLLPLASPPPSATVAARYLELADLYAGQGDIESAQEVCRQLLILSPGFQPAIDRLETLTR